MTQASTHRSSLPPRQGELPWQHRHDFSTGHAAAERGTRQVAWITAGMMLLEIAAGWVFNSMALLADGWHMSSHAVAIGLSALAYAAARRYAGDTRFAFGTWKIEVLGGFASALFLLGVGVLMMVGSLRRLLAPEPIDYLEALVVGVLGLAVNLVCARILLRAHGPDPSPQHGHRHSHGHAHGHSDGHTHRREHTDLNLRAAYLHVLADAATSVLAIVALAGGWWLGWAWLDPLMGLIGAALVGHWAMGLLGQTSSALLDRDMDHPVVQDIREVLQMLEDTEMTDLHVWRVGPSHYACALTLVTSDPSLDAARVRAHLTVHREIVHSTIEIHRRPASPA